jgi:hypothetical protein
MRKRLEAAHKQVRRQLMNIASRKLWNYPAHQPPRALRPRPIQPRYRTSTSTLWMSAKCQGRHNRVQVPRNLLCRLALDEVVAPDPRNRHNAASPDHPLRIKAGSLRLPNFRLVNFERRSPAQGALLQAETQPCASRSSSTSLPSASRSPFSLLSQVRRTA